MLSRRFQGWITVLAWFSLTSTAQAAWTWDELKGVEAIKLAPIKLTNGYLSSIWGSLQAMNAPSTLHSEVLQLASVKGLNKGLAVRVAARPIGDGPRPVVFFIPGMFADSKNGLALRMQEALYENGSHVVLVPNPWSPEFAVSAPIFETGDGQGESDAFLDVLRQVVTRELGPSRVSGFSLMGQSYGALLASLMASKLKSTGWGAGFDGRLILFSPTADMHASMLRIDSSLEQTEFGYQSACASLSAKLGYLQLAKQTPYEPAPFGTLQCARSTFFHSGFREKLATFALVQQKVSGIHWIPNDAAGRAVWKGNLTMESFLKQVSPGVYAQITAPGNGKTLCDVIQASRKRLPNVLDLKLLTSVDDPLNDPKAWASTAACAFETDEVHALPFGGHSGFLAFPEFDHVLVKL